MIDKVIAITGAMRSGTSLVAQIVHRLGYQVSPIIPAPAPPSWRSDWEDPRLTERLMRREKIDWVDYIARRRDESEATGFDGYVAVKSPYLALQWATLCAEIPVFSIGVFREREERRASVAQHPALSAEDEREIDGAVDAMRDGYDLKAGYNALIARPPIYATHIARALDVTDVSAIVAAARLVKEPTNYGIRASQGQ